MRPAIPPAVSALAAWRTTRSLAIEGLPANESAATLLAECAIEDRRDCLVVCEAATASPAAPGAEATEGSSRCAASRAAGPKARCRRIELYGQLPQATSDEHFAKRRTLSPCTCIGKCFEEPKNNGITGSCRKSFSPQMEAEAHRLLGPSQSAATDGASSMTRTAALPQKAPASEWPPGSAPRQASTSHRQSRGKCCQPRG
mmetsp:Transcript_170275/g.546135  ORF Transcript_170275/g.546135 Transcript_170275/m.546135 type:complete len:201 (+) Transcript_170275:214-816(+)